MLPKIRPPVRQVSELLFRQRCMQLAQSVSKLNGSLAGTAAPAAKGHATRQAITETINSMSTIVKQAAPKELPGAPTRKRLRLSVPDILLHRSKGILPRETIRAGFKEGTVERIGQNNILSSTARLADVDSTLEMIEFVNNHILSDQKTRPTPQRRCLTQKALALLTGE